MTYALPAAPLGNYYYLSLASFFVLMVLLIAFFILHKAYLRSAVMQKWLKCIHFGSVVVKDNHTGTLAVVSFKIDL